LTVIVIAGAEAPTTTVIFPLLVWPTMRFSRSGEGATAGSPRLVSQNSAVRARRRGTGPTRVRSTF